MKKEIASNKSLLLGILSEYNVSMRLTEPNNTNKINESTKVITDENIKEVMRIWNNFMLFDSFRSFFKIHANINKNKIMNMLITGVKIFIILVTSNLFMKCFEIKNN